MELQDIVRRFRMKQSIKAIKREIAARARGGVLRDHGAALHPPPLSGIGTTTDAPGDQARLVGRLSAPVIRKTQRKES